MIQSECEGFRSVLGNSKPNHISTRRPTASHLTGLKEDPGNDSAMEMVSEQPNRGPTSRMAVIYDTIVSSS